MTKIFKTICKKIEWPTQIIFFEVLYGSIVTIIFINFLVVSVSTQRLVTANTVQENQYLVFVPGSWYTAPKSLGTPRMKKVSFVC